MTTAQAIETKYAGHRFRSRLEARWAVFFDHVGMKWQYEPQGFEIGPTNRRRWYLPDFYLPEVGVWVEVKSGPDSLDFQTLADAANPEHGLPASPEGGVLNCRRMILLLLFQVPERSTLHAALGPADGRLGIFQAALACYPNNVEPDPRRHLHEVTPIGYPFRPSPDRQTGEARRPPPGLIDSYGMGFPCWQIQSAYTAARSSRFEHGESGTPVRHNPPPDYSPSPDPSLVPAQRKARKPKPKARRPEGDPR